MDIVEFGGEFKLIEAIVKKVSNEEVELGVGDDAAVMKARGGIHQLVSSDMFIDGNHFSTRFYQPLQIGKKMVEGSASDIVAMGGKAKFILVSIGLRRQLEVAYVRSIYRGIYSSCAKLGITLIGGDTVKSSKLIANVTVIGEVSEENLCLRSGAKEGDLIKISGPCGGSSAGLNLLIRRYEGHENVKRMHLEPACRADIVEQIAPYANAMIDVSDGIASEVKHIAKASKLGAEIYTDDIPLHNAMIHSARALKESALNFALYGGEDFELLFTVSPENESKTPGVVIGKMTAGNRIMLTNKLKQESQEMVKSGYKNF